MNSFPIQEKDLLNLQSTSWLLMALWHKDPEHQQPWYWPSETGIILRVEFPGGFHFNVLKFQLPVIASMLPLLFLSGDHFTNDSSTTIQIRWKFNFAEVLVKWFIWNFAHAKLCRHGMCNIVYRYDKLHWSYTKYNFHRILITIEKSFDKWATGICYGLIFSLCHSGLSPDICILSSILGLFPLVWDSAFMWYLRAMASLISNNYGTVFDLMWSGTRPTNRISIEYEIRSKFGAL